MKTLVAYYSFSGKTAKLAKERAEKEGADLWEIVPLKRYSLFTAYLRGARQAMKQVATAIEKPKADLDSYEKIILAAPVWAGFPAPPFNAAAELLPAGKKVEIIFCSASGGPTKGAQATKELIEKRGCEVLGYEDLKPKK